MKGNGKVDCAYAERSEVTPELLTSISNLMTEDYVFFAISHEFRSFAGTHRLFKRMESGEVKVYSAYGVDGHFLGCAFGEDDGLEPGQFYGHIMFYRVADALECMRLIEQVCIENHRDEGKELTSICACIPDYCYAAQRLAKRLGYTDQGYVPDLEVKRGEDDRNFKCKRFVKKV